MLECFQKMCMDKKKTTIFFVNLLLTFWHYYLAKSMLLIFFQIFVDCEILTFQSNQLIREKK